MKAPWNKKEKNFKHYTRKAQK